MEKLVGGEQEGGQVPPEAEGPPSGCLDLTEGPGAKEGVGPVCLVQGRVKLSHQRRLLKTERSWELSAVVERGEAADPGLLGTCWVWGWLVRYHGASPVDRPGPADVLLGGLVVLKLLFGDVDLRG